MFQALSNVHQSKTVKATAAMLVATFIGVVTVQADDKKIEVTIKNKTNVLITVKFNDAANKQFSPEVKANDVVKCSVDPKTKSIQWQAFTKSSSASCESNTLSISSSTPTLEVTKCVENTTDAKKAEEKKAAADKAAADKAAADKAAADKAAADKAAAAKAAAAKAAVHDCAVKPTCGSWAAKGNNTCRTCQQALCKTENGNDVLAGNKTQTQCYDGHGAPPSDLK
jgi:membrane protein involved in colicin uptake